MYAVYYVEVVAGCILTHFIKESPMEIEAETNKVLDKLAEILGATGSDVVDAYTEGVFYRGVKDAALCVFFFVLFSLGIKAGLYGARILFDDGDEKGIFYSVVGGVSTLLGFFGFLICIGDAVTRICAPQAEAIQVLMDQLSRF